MVFHIHSYFSLRYGLLAPEDIMAWAGRERMSLVLGDINNASAACNWLKAAREQSEARAHVGVHIKNGAQDLYLLISRSQTGFAAINRFVSDYLLNEKPFPVHPPRLKDCDALVFFKDWHKQDPGSLPMHAWVAVRAEDLPRLRLSPWKRESERLLAYKRMSLWSPEDAETHHALRCIDANCLYSTLPEVNKAGPHDFFQRQADALKPFEEAPELVLNAERLLEGGDWQFDWKEAQNRKTYSGDPDEDYRMMSELAHEGLKYRYPRFTYATTQRLEKEMKAIYELGFTAYFLINWDICRYARQEGFFYVGRGSGANSMVAYCLRITDVDPIELDLYFERFINPFRSSPPDFDLDFSWQDRDQVTSYILQKYGQEHAALLGTYNTFQTNAVIRELGKVYGLPKHEIDHLLNKPSYYSPSTFEEYSAPSPSDIYSQPGMGKRVRSRKLGRGGETPNEQNKKHIYSQLMRQAQRIHNLPNYRSLHVGGILISHKTLYHFSPLEMPPKGFPSVQFSMLEAEDLGLAKFDILSQRGLGHIKDTVKIIAENRGETVDPHRTREFKQDPRIARMLKGGHTMGCFYVESPAMRQLLRKLACDDYPTLVAASSVIRPGVAQSGMMRSFIERHVQPEKRTEAHPVLHAIMPETYGIMVYQEDVIRVAHEFAGLGLAESDVLRRGMSGKFRSKDELKQVKDRFFELAQTKGQPHALIQSVWQQIESFAGYSFAKGHSASYAVESYQSLYLKAYYPLEFYTAVINNFGGFYRTEFYVHAARMCGAQVEAPCLNNSRWLTHLEGQTLWLGLGLVQGLEQKLAERLLRERSERGPYCGLLDFKERCNPGLEQSKVLIRLGALRFTQKSRKALLWEAHSLMRQALKTTIGVQPLFQREEKAYNLPSLEDSPLELAYDEKELLGFSLSSPFLWVKEDGPRSHIRARHFAQVNGKRVAIDGYLVTVKPTRTQNGQEMNFGTWIDAEGQFFDSVHFPPSLRAYPFKGRSVYRLEGRVTEDFGVYSLEVERMQKAEPLPDPRYSD